jgi:hypothetical protein
MPQGPGLPGIVNRKSNSVPDKNAPSTSSTFPDIHGIKLIPAVVTIEARGLEIAPQMRVSIPNPVSLITLLGRKCSLISVSNREYSRSSPASTTNNLEAVSKTGETLPFQVGTAIFMVDFFKVCLSAAFTGSLLRLPRSNTHHALAGNKTSLVPSGRQKHQPRPIMDR